MEGMMHLYTTIGYPCHACSALQSTGIGALRESLEKRTTLFSGHSGVGKSTLLNKLIPDLNLRTAEISAAHDTGMHTTTFSEMFSLPGGGYVIDTPGIKGFGTFDFEKEEWHTTSAKFSRFRQTANTTIARTPMSRAAPYASP